MERTSMIVNRTKCYDWKALSIYTPMDFRKDPPIDYENNLNIQDSIYGPAYKNSTHLFPIRLWISL